MMLKASPQSGQSVTVENDCGNNQRQATAAWQRFHHSVKLRLKLAASLVAFITSFGLALASETPQKEPSPLEQRTVGPLHLGMTMRQVRNMLGPSIGTNIHDEEFFYKDSQYLLTISPDYNPLTIATVNEITIKEYGRGTYTYPIPDIPQSLGPIKSWKWLGKPLSHPPRDRHPVGLLSKFFRGEVPFADGELEGPGVTFHSRYINVAFLGVNDESHFHAMQIYHNPLTPQGVPSPHEQRTLGPLRLGMPLQKVLTILGSSKGPRKLDDALVYRDKQYLLTIDAGGVFPHEKLKDLKAKNIIIEQCAGPYGFRCDSSIPYVPKSLGSIMSWKWLGKPLSYPPRDRHPVGLSYNFFQGLVPFADGGAEGPGVTFHSRYVDVGFLALGDESHRQIMLRYHDPLTHAYSVETSP